MIVYKVKINNMYVIILFSNNIYMVIRFLFSHINLLVIYYQQLLPPSITRFAPVIYDDASETINTIAALYSSL